MDGAAILMSEAREPGKGILIAHGACFVGMLLRQTWSRPLCAALPLAWAALLLTQIADHLLRDSRTERL